MVHIALVASKSDLAKTVPNVQGQRFKDEINQNTEEMGNNKCAISVAWKDNSDEILHKLYFTFNSWLQERNDIIIFDYIYYIKQISIFKF